MPNHAIYDTDADLLDAVRKEIAADPLISQAELRERVRGTNKVVIAAMRAARVEAGLERLREGEQLDPRFADLIRKAEPPAPLDLRARLPEEFTRAVADHLARTQEVVGGLLERMQHDAVAAMEAERVRAQAHADAADARATRAEEYVETLRREAAEAAAETERVRAVSAEDRGRQALEIAALARSVEQARADLAHAETDRATAVAERKSAEAALRDARDQAVTLGRDVAAAGARLQELDRQVADLGARLTRADAELAAARAAEAEARAAAAAARATVSAHEATIARLEEVITSLRASKDERDTSEAHKRR